MKTNHTNLFAGLLILVIVAATSTPTFAQRRSGERGNRVETSERSRSNKVRKNSTFRENEKTTRTPRESTVRSRRSSRSENQGNVKSSRPAQKTERPSVNQNRSVRKTERPSVNRSRSSSNDRRISRSTLPRVNRESNPA
ncbi:MAG TPA: hypothetical protein VJ919_01390, partial [Tangfeifania sp.]|nr:hypothetical protein [Tangfeifania sp.]